VSQLAGGSRGPPATVLTTPACCSINSRQKRNFFWI